MTTLKFADTHNMVAFLSKPAESEGFEQIVDFLNAHSIKHALTVNPIIYTSCIEQFWATVKAKTVNGEVQLQALVDGKKIIITESTVRRDLQLEDADGVDCLPNASIFEQLTLMGYKPKVQLFKMDSAGKFLMYPRFVQVFLNKQVDGMASHKRIYIAPSHTKKIFGNMRRVGKGFSRRETPLFQTMVVQDQAEMGEDEPVNEEMDDSLVRAATTVTSLDAEQDRDTIAHTRFENVSKHSNNPLLARGNTLRSGEDRLKLKKLMELCTNLQTRVLDLETTKTTQANEIASLKRRVKKLERRNKSRTHRLKRLYRVGSSRRVESSEDVGLGEEDAYKQGRIADIDATKDIYLVNVHHDEDMFGVNDLEGDEVLVESEGVVKTVKERINVVEEVADIIDAAKSVSAVGENISAARENINAAEETVSATSILVSAAATTVSAASEIPTVTTADELTLAQALAE
ncbi:hypothetical protein Tco_0066109 [Tanacetum coccineum]